MEVGFNGVVRDDTPLDELLVLGGHALEAPVRAQRHDEQAHLAGEEEDVGLAARNERLLVADRHARGGVDEVAGTPDGHVRRRRGRR